MNKLIALIFISFIVVASATNFRKLDTVCYQHGEPSENQEACYCEYNTPGGCGDCIYRCNTHGEEHIFPNCGFGVYPGEAP